MQPTFDYDSAAKMADDDVIRDAVPGDVDDCWCRGRATGDVYRSSRRRQRASGDASPGRWPLRTPDGTATTCRRMNGGIAASRTIGSTSAESLSTTALSSDRTLLAGVDPACGTTCPLLSVRLTDAIWQPDAGGNSILQRSVSVVLRCRRRQYARSRRRRRRCCATDSGLVTSIAASLLAAALLVGSVTADPHRLHGESSHTAAAHSRQLSPAESSNGRGAPRWSQSDDIGAGSPCIYEGHIKTDR